MEDISKSTDKSRSRHFVKPCSVCNKRLVNYVCPRCNQGFCTVECSRSLQHQSCLAGAPQPGQSKSTADRENILHILKRNDIVAPEDGGPLQLLESDNDMVRFLNTDEAVEDHQDDDKPDGLNLGSDAEVDDDEGEEDEENDRRREDLQKRMAGLDIEDANFEEIWERLDSQEREEFVKLAQELEEREGRWNSWM